MAGGVLVGTSNDGVVRSAFIVPERFFFDAKMDDSYIWNSCLWGVNQTSQPTCRILILAFFGSYKL